MNPSKHYSGKTVPFPVVFVLFYLMLLPSLGAQEQKSDYTGFLEMAGVHNAEIPQYTLKNIENSFHQKIHASNLEYLQANPEIIEKIRSDLGGEALRWRLKSISHRLLYSPENRPEYARLYETYCKEIIAEVLGALDLQTPYSRIVTLTAESLPLENTDGFTAYIVHDLTVDYRAQYEFSNDSKKTLGMELSGQYATGEVGSYSSELVFGDDGDIHFVHDTYTIWQDNAKNPYTVLMTPVEETLHFLLRSATEAAIHATVTERSGCTPGEAEEIVADWISVEEAVVGGLVHELFLPILENKIGPIPEALISEDLTTKETFTKYQKLRKGIHLVDEMGSKACLERYLNNPLEFKTLLL